MTKQSSARSFVESFLRFETLKDTEFPYGLSVSDLVELANRFSAGHSESAIRAALRRMVKNGEVIQWIEMGIKGTRLVDLYTPVDLGGLQPPEMIEALTMHHCVHYPEELSRKNSRAEVLYYYRALERARMGNGLFTGQPV